MELSITELEMYDSISSDLRYAGNTSGLEDFTEAADKGGGCGRCRAGIFSKVASETGVDDNLFSHVGFGELEEEYTLRRILELSPR